MFCFILYYLERYPEVERRLRQEFDTILGKDSTRLITCKDLDGLEYCDAVIKEVYRHCPVFVIIGRVNFKVIMLEDIIGQKELHFKHFFRLNKS